MPAASTLLILATLAGYALLCAIRPFAVCRKCSGTGLRDARRAMKLCRRCRGTRYRLRAGRRLHHHVRRLHNEGTRTRPTADKEHLPWQ
ncbi:hypothetical protein [Streptomyces sioyaensis]|uniref:hypothetical protein n=1 Tax=Streptomyces sioyaensis TaxID=67364 RepID=UPI003712A3E0